jgi:hypothetical protein
MENNQDLLRKTIAIVASEQALTSIEVTAVVVFPLLGLVPPFRLSLPFLPFEAGKWYLRCPLHRLLFSPSSGHGVTGLDLTGDKRRFVLQN